MKADAENAFKVVAQACATFQGNLQQHQAIQNALAIVARELDRVAVLEAQLEQKSLENGKADEAIQ
jgi:hypothetical protein